VYRWSGEGFVVEAGTLLANDLDADGDPLSLIGISATSSHGATLALNGRFVTYTPPVGYNGEDTFTYNIADSRGASASALVTVSVLANTMQIVSVQALPANQVGLTLNAMANQACTLLFSPTLVGRWRPVTNYPAAPTNRVIQVSFPRTGPSGFYRLQSPVPLSTVCVHLF